METHSLKLLFHPFAVSGKGELKMLLLNLNVVEMFIIKVKHTSGEGNGNPLQYSCLENSLDKGGWQVYSPWGNKESDTTERLSQSIPKRHSIWVS